MGFESCAPSSRGARRALTLLLLLSFAIACGDDDGTDGGVDAGMDGDIPDGMIPDGEIPDGGMDGGDGGVPTDLFTPPTITTCPGDALPSLADAACEVTEGGDAVLITADVLTPGEVFRGGQVLVGADGRIACVGCDCSAMATGATEVVCPDGVVSPGLINAHDHVTFGNTVPYAAAGMFTDERYEHRHDWRTGRNGHDEVSAGGGRARTEDMQWVELTQVMSGTTSVNGSGGSDGLLRNLDNNSDNGLMLPAADYSTFPLGDSGGNTMDMGCGYDYADDSMDAAGPEAFVPHVSEGIDHAARNEFLCVLDGMHDFVTPNSAFIHGVGLQAQDIGQMALEGTKLIWSPRTNITLYGDTARVTEYARIGVTIALGTDWIRSGSMNMLRELACADSFNGEHLGGFFPDEQLWLMATRNGALALGVETELGVLATGRMADLAIYDARERTDHRAVLGAAPQDVVLVMRGGTVLYGDASVVNGIVSGCDAIDVCTSNKAVCLADIGTTFPALDADVHGGTRSQPVYPLFFCGEPDDEPSCDPMRNAMSPLPDPEVNGSNRYTGMSSMDDMDGDGLLNAMDNCPSIFNPIRPLDDGAQADFDSDGVGDACDSCPLGGDADPSTCNAVDPNDRDNDTIANAEDNCPNDPNTDQADMDDDGKGDVCDPCPMAPNPGAAACPSTVYEINDGTIPLGTAVSLSGLIVTGVASNGYWIQQDPTSTDFDGIDFSGIFVFTSTMPTGIGRGDRVDIVSAMVSEFGGGLQLATPTAMVTMAGGSVPAPVVVEPAEIATGGARAAALTGVLVRVETVTVVANDLGFGEFSVDDGLRVDDQMYLADPFPAVGEMLASITGPLNFNFDDTKIEPRDSADLVFAGLRLTPAAARVTLGSTIEFRVSIPTPAPAGGAMVAIVVAPATVLTGPLVITVPAGMNQGSATYTAAATEMSGTVTATYMAMTAMATVDVVEAVGGSLIISEYVEGSGNNKALELYNGVGTIDLTACTLRRYTNGASTFTAIPLTGSLAAGETQVLCHNMITDTSRCDVMTGNVNHNGNDAYDLVCDGMLIDSFGQIGTDPGMAGWTGGGLSTTDRTLRRKCTVTEGDTTPGDAFDPSVEYDGSPINTFDGLGSRGC